jgi:hypothetical protein
MFVQRQPYSLIPVRYSLIEYGVFVCGFYSLLKIVAGFVKATFTV